MIYIDNLNIAWPSLLRHLLRRRGLAVELFKSVPYGKRAILVAKQSNVDELFQKAELVSCFLEVALNYRKNHGIIGIKHEHMMKHGVLWGGLIEMCRDF